MEIVNAIVRNQIDVARARLVLRALSIAARNATKTHFDWSKSEMVKEIPQYPAAPPSAGPFAAAIAQAAALATINTPQVPAIPAANGPGRIFSMKFSLQNRFAGVNAALARGRSFHVVPVVPALRPYDRLHICDTPHCIAVTIGPIEAQS